MEIGTIIFSASMFAIAGYLPADGRCLRSAEYPELARVMSENGKFPYGECFEGGFGFRLPDLRPTDRTAGLAKALIKVTP